MYARIDYNVNNIITPKEKKTKRVKGAKKVRKNQRNKNDYAVRVASRSFLTAIQTVNSKVGSYTGNKIQTRNMSTNFRVASYGIIATINPYLAIGKSAIDLTQNTIDYVTRVLNSEEEVNYKTSLIGNATTSNSRWRGTYR